MEESSKRLKICRQARFNRSSISVCPKSKAREVEDAMESRIVEGNYDGRHVLQLVDKSVKNVSGDIVCIPNRFQEV